MQDRERKLDKIMSRLDYLAGRWKDESEYEDFEEYRTSIKNLIEEQGGKFISLTKQFVLKFTFDGKNWKAKVTAKQVEIYSEV